ncbi:hypothetical protein HDU97_000973 [Phlyctochytrium planicorne]|nr:hypothetical protein HDU97_000973 [Phlyctochytrium planicorne]
MTTSPFTPLTHHLKTTAPHFIKLILRTLSTLPLPPTTYPLDHICFRTSTPQEYLHRQQELQSLPGCIKLTETSIGGRPISTYRLPEEWSIIVECPYTFGSGTGWSGKGRFGMANEADEGARVIRILELPSPKQGREYASGWEHVEFSIGVEREIDGVADKQTSGTKPSHEEIERLALDALESFRASHEGVKWDVRGLGKGGINPDLRLDFVVARKPLSETSGDDKVYRLVDDTMDASLGDRVEFSVKFHHLPLELVVGIEEGSLSY